MDLSGQSSSEIQAHYSGLANCQDWPWKSARGEGQAFLNPGPSILQRFSWPVLPKLCYLFWALMRIIYSFCCLMRTGYVKLIAGNPAAKICGFIIWTTPVICCYSALTSSGDVYLTSIPDLLVSINLLMSGCSSAMDAALTLSLEADLIVILFIIQNFRHIAICLFVGPIYSYKINSVCI